MGLPGGRLEDVLGTSWAVLVRFGDPYGIFEGSQAGNLAFYEGPGSLGPETLYSTRAQGHRPPPDGAKTPVQSIPT